MGRGAWSPGRTEAEDLKAKCQGKIGNCSELHPREKRERGIDEK